MKDNWQIIFYPKFKKKRCKYKLEIDYLKKSQNRYFFLKKNYNLQSNFYYQNIIKKKFKSIFFWIV